MDEAMTETTTKECTEEFREHCRAAWRAWGQSWRTLIPEGFLEKNKEGQREALLAARSLIDMALDKLGSEEASRAKPNPKVKVEAD
jgi:hypothetical protein